MNKFLFYLSSRLFGESDLELCIFKYSPKLKVYLTKRDKKDPYFSNKLALPGVRKVPEEFDDDHLNRLLNEIPFYISVSSVEYVASTTLKTKRGTEFADIRRVFIDDVEDNNFYDVDNLPYNIVNHHKEVIFLGMRCIK